ncbi:tryptophan-rich sensory protein TspO [Parasulfitobacter algicola]|uniref:Tryptophan-rich sensory protein n=1 Tax=Parasulfitobacter algicola TaxID=2614809 RepID=A0ABX2ISL1_9RHOB|nr:TspO/MBR family protein [Sulfitobacter algicola]NSX53349.1 tryptophan-rich sensory protein [Sulfitobacter algicola]
MDWLVFIVYLAACMAAAATGAMFQPGQWYKDLTKPAWTPPDWLFPIAWTALYLIIAYAAMRASLAQGAALATAFWAFQIALNTLWSPVFFGLRKLKTALIVIIFLWIAVVGTMVSFYMVDMIAGLLIVPYLIWVSYAGALNFAIVRMNATPTATVAS